MDIDYIRVYPGILKYVHRTREPRALLISTLASRTYDGCKVIKVTSSTTTSEVIAKALADFGIQNVSADKYSLVEVLLISNSNFTDRVLQPNEYPLRVLRQQRKVSGTSPCVSSPPTSSLVRRNLCVATA